MRTKITGEDFKGMVINGAHAIENNKQPINELNVFPVPDGDTGTNMSMTIGNGATVLSTKEAGTIGEVASSAASGLLRGARGNSGVILSLLFRGIGKYLKEMEDATAADFAQALKCGVETAYSAVMRPAEGTILTVSRLTAAAAVEFAQEDEDIESVIEKSIKVGYEALAETVNQNPVLKKAGVVDAGGKGFLIILEGMLKYLRGEKIEVDSSSAAAAPVKEKADFTDFNTEDIKFCYCTEFIVGRENDKDVNKLRAFLDSLGDSIVVVDDEEVIKTHVHTNQPGVVLTEALTYGSLLTVKIENMRQQHTSKVIEASEVEAAEEAPAFAEATKKYGIVAVCAGDGMAQIFKDLSADGVVTGGQTMNPSTEDILKQVNLTPAEVVFVLPNNKNIIMAAQQCVDLTEKKVIVIETKTVPQGITAIMNFDQDLSEEENAEAMRSAITTVHTAQITYAVRDSDVDGKAIKCGDYLAMLEGALISNSPSSEDVIAAVTESFKGFDPEFINVYYGEDVDEDTANNVGGVMEKAFPDAEINVICGGQPVYYFMISAE